MGSGGGGRPDLGSTQHSSVRRALTFVQDRSFTLSERPWLRASVSRRCPLGSRGLFSPPTPGEALQLGGGPVRPRREVSCHLPVLQVTPLIWVVFFDGSHECWEGTQGPRVLGECSTTSAPAPRWLS